MKKKTYTAPDTFLLTTIKTATSLLAASSATFELGGMDGVTDYSTMDKPTGRQDADAKGTSFGYDCPGASSSVWDD